MKKYHLLFILFTISLSHSGVTIWGRVPHVYVATYAVNDYSKYEAKYGHATRSLPLSVENKNVFVNNLFKFAKLRYPSIKTAHGYDRTDASVTEYNYRNDFISRSDFMFFSGHGNLQMLALYDEKFDISKRPLGGSTLWAFFDACLVLNVNKTAFLSQPLSTETIDFSKVDKLRKVFNGVHAILGNYANGKQVYVENSEKSTSNVYREFASRFIGDSWGWTIWDAYSTAVGVTYNSMRKYDDRGLMPAIAFLRGYDENGVYHDTSMETFDNVYRNPLKISGTLELFVMYKTFGKPTFDF